LILVGFALIGEGLDFHIPKGYIYFAMAFSVVVELLNLRLRKKRVEVREPVQLKSRLNEDLTKQEVDGEVRILQGWRRRAKALEEGLGGMPPRGAVARRQARAVGQDAL